MCCLDLRSWYVSVVGVLLCVTEIRGKCVAGLYIPVWLNLWLELRHHYIVGIEEVNVIWGYSWLRFQNMVGLAMCRSLLVVIRWEGQGAARFGWSLCGHWGLVGYLEV